MKTINDYPEIMAMWHPTKNGDLKITDFKYSSRRVAWWQCKNGHEWESSFMNRTSGGGRGCPYCDRKVSNSKCLAVVFPKVAAEWHPVKNGKLTPRDVTAKSGRKCWFKCKQGHEWKTMVAHRSNGHGCPYCDGKKVCIDNCFATKFPVIASEWHPTKNGDLTPENVAAGSVKKIWWKCAKDHEWLATPNHRGNGKGCPCCNESRGEKKVADVLLCLNLSFKRQVAFETCKYKSLLKFDFTIETDNGIKIVEYQGEQHYMPIAFGGRDPKNEFEIVKKRDLIKRKWCKSQNIPLLEIPYWDYDKIILLINNFLIDS